MIKYDRIVKYANQFFSGHDTGGFIYKLRANLHTHTYHSDGVHTPTAIVRYAKRTGVGVISITDHNEIRGTILGARLAQKLEIIFFPGIELTFAIKGRPYEILAYFYDVEDIQKFYQEYRFQNGFLPTFKNVGEVINIINKHHGVEVVPHPFGRKGIFRRLRNRGLNVNAIEVINAFTGEKRNNKAKRHQDSDNNFIKLGASDMHFFLADINRVYTELRSRREITKETIWASLQGEGLVDFIPIGHQFSKFKIWFQKPLCALIYFVNYPRLYWNYKNSKRKHIEKH